MSKLIIGCGYLGRRVADLWSSAGHRVFALTRSTERGQELADSGIEPIIGDITDPTSLASLSQASLPNCDSVLIAVGHDRKSGKTINETYVNGLSNVLAHLPDEPQKIIYVSSTGVYGDFAGNWVDEDSPCNPTREGGKACLAAEDLLSHHAKAQNRIVLRLAGIYGPDRLPYLSTIQEGEPLAAAPSGNLNLIHVDDAARIVELVDQRGQTPNTYLVSDGQPVLRREYYAMIAKLLDAPDPVFTEAQNGDRIRRSEADKRICNKRLLKDLAPQFSYPSYREGLANILADH